MEWPERASAHPSFPYHSKPFKTEQKLPVLQSERPPAGKARFYTGFNPRAEVLLLQLATADNSPVSNPPLSGSRFPHLHPLRRVLCSPDDCFCRGRREAGAGRRHLPHSLFFPRWLPLFSSPHCTLCAGGTRLKRPLKRSRELPWWFQDGARNCYFWLC